VEVHDERIFYAAFHLRREAKPVREYAAEVIPGERL
jgi:hypothetical protein